jgi:kynurenine 3-monooxygenase
MPIGEGRSVTIVGAGLAGSLLACYMAKLGFRVDVYERRSDPRSAGYVGGRSINLALSARGLWGLAGIGLEKDVLTRAIPMKGRMIHPATMPEEGMELPFQPYSHDPKDAINSISRGGLNLALIEAAATRPGVTFHFDHRCLDIDTDACAATFQHESGGVMGEGPIVRVESDLIVGADGAFSPVRGRMQKNDRFEYSQTYLSHGYKELHIPAIPDAKGKWNGYAMDPNALHIWPRGSAMMIALPNPDKTFTCTLFWPFEGDHSFANLKTAEQVRTFFGKNYPDAVRLMPTLVEDFLKNPTSSLVTVRCWPWVQRSRGGRAVVLAGDAAHAIVPFFGQGMNAAFEDVRVFSECLEKHAGRGEHWMQEAAEEYQTLRKPNADAIARMAIDNFVEMRDKVGSRVFLWKKKAEHLLHDLAPETLTPKYNLVSFSTVPYADALKRGTRIDRVLRLVGLLVSLLVAGTLVALGMPAGVLLIVVMVGAAVVWDRWRVREDTRV